MPSMPRFSKSDRLLHRFYEPLVLLTILSPSTSVKTGRSSTSVSFNDAQDRHSNFLDHLSWVCDYKCGGTTVSAIAAEEIPIGPVYWLAAPGLPSEKARKHLQGILEKLGSAHGSTKTEIESLQESITVRCINFSRKKVKHYRQMLSKRIEECKLLSAKGGHQLDQQLMTDLEAGLDQGDTDIDFCQSAYNFRRTDSLDRLTEKHNLHDESSAWSEARHYIGRLGSWTKAAKVLVQTAALQPKFVDGFTVKQLGIPTPAWSPQADSMTTLESALGRMFPAGSEDRATTLDTLQSIRVFDVATRFRLEYTNKNFKPLVHAEAALLEHFHQNQMRHMNNYKYIGCSKPSCYCCNLYFQFHPGHFVMRPCHGNVWKKWCVPLLPSDDDKSITKYHTREILNEMIARLRSEVKNVVETKVCSSQRLPDSTTGISKSLVDRPGLIVEPRPLINSDGMPLEHFMKNQTGMNSSANASNMGLPCKGKDSGHGRGNTPSLNAKVSTQKPIEAESEDVDEEVILFQGRSKLKGSLA